MLEFLHFELRYRLRQPAVYMLALIFALFTFGATTTDAVALFGGTGQTAINAPLVVIRVLASMSVVAVILVTAYVATAVTRDFELRTDALFFSKPIREAGFLLGRFLGAVAVSLLVLLAAAVGVLVGMAMPWLDPERLAPFSAAPHVFALLVLVLPNLFVTGAFCFAIASLTRRVLTAYVGVVAFFVIYSLADSLLADLDLAMVGALADPFGLAALDFSTRYWTPVERNTLLMPPGGVLWLNRALWLGVAAACLVATVRRFSFATRVGRPKRAIEAPGEDAATAASLVTVRPCFSPATRLVQLGHVARAELATVLRGKAFVVILLLGVLSVIGGAMGPTDAFYGTPVLPVTRHVVHIIDERLLLPLIIVIAFYAGELVFAERQAGLHELCDAMPVPTWVPLLGKLGALWGAVFVMLGVAGLAGVGVQLVQGYTRLELGLYVVGLFGLSFSQWMLLCVLALFFHVLAGRELLGWLLMLLCVISQDVLPALDLVHGLYRFGWAPDAPYSEMNGYGHFLPAVLWYRLYWALFSAGLVVVASLLWVRGTDTRLRSRLREARRRATRLHMGLLAGLMAGVLGVGAVILHETTVLGRYRTDADRAAALARYERTYKAEWDGALQPRVVAVDLEVDIFPHEREVALRGTIELVNEHDTSIERLMVLVEPDLVVASLGLPEAALLERDEELGVWIYRLEPALAPGATLAFPFELRFRELGFMNHGSNTRVVGNGTFLHNEVFVPRFGYERFHELSDPNERRERGLPKRERMRPPTDPAARANTYLTREGDWIRFSATLSTSKPQIALAPGYLVREWEAGERRFFRYEMDAPILDRWAILSADYTVARDRWNDVAIEVYYHAPHAANVPRMIEAVKASLDYFTAEFSPYQHRQVRIMEFPRYEAMAQAFSNTIPYSEDFGFIADLRDEDGIDYVTFMTAHEVAHEWWAFQVIGAEAQGSTLLSESLAQYSALMVMEQLYGRVMARRFREHELHRYLMDRGAERERELPLWLVEADQRYVHYAKGCLVLYALREVMGEDVLHGVLRQFLADFAFEGPPFPTSLELVQRIRAAMPERFVYLVEDLLETITLYDQRVSACTSVPLGEGRWRVDVVIEARKLRSDGAGAEVEVPMDDWVQVGVMGEDAEAEPIYLEWHRITSGRNELSIEVSAGEPKLVGVDPRGLFIDREPGDNTSAPVTVRIER